MKRPQRLRARSAGFAYVFLLMTVALIGLFSAASVSLGSQASRREAERELLAVGAEFEQALKSYARVSGGAGFRGNGPQALKDLLEDPRFPTPKRHLRQIYADPLTGRSEWGLLREPGGTIVAVYSTADGAPIQRSGFEPEKAGFENAESYAVWIFGLPIATLPNNQRGATIAEPVNKRNSSR